MPRYISNSHQSTQISTKEMDSRHHELLSKAIRIVLSTEIARFTYAQIVDGLPTYEVFLDKRFPRDHILHPIQHHKTLCSGVLDRTQRLLDEFCLDSLVFNNRVSVISFVFLSFFSFQHLLKQNFVSQQLLNSYKDAPVGSHCYEIRLLEMIAVAVHQIAAQLFKRDESLHNYDGVTSWKRPYVDHGSHCREPDPYPTLFYHQFYTYHEQYPEGVADMVGYWAENRILGGVVLFDRRVSGFGNNRIYFHSDRADVTYRIYRLLQSQVQALIEFLESPSPSTARPCPIPVLGDKYNRERIDPDDAIDYHGVFRDRWEREVPVKDDWYYRNLSCVRLELDYPEVEDERMAAELAEY
ncbi:hypothetical protein F5884DRAFT_80998 [Xylogone sp. PMI_703]|nr:hypothetical protein F5884DRAFT_80998 [Xylogone sp. PMI_703]